MNEGDKSYADGFEKIDEAVQQQILDGIADMQGKKFGKKFYKTPLERGKFAQILL